MSAKLLLGKIGLQEKYICRSPNFDFWDTAEFKYYNNPAPIDPYIKEMDEVYRFHESRLLHLRSGIRIRMQSSEDYTGEEVTYSLYRPHIIMPDGREIDAEDIDFEKEVIIAEGNEIPLKEVKK